MASEDDEDTAGRFESEPRLAAHESAPTSSPVLSYDSARRANLKTLRQMPAFEANLAAAKLEAAGVPAFVADQNVAVAHPLLFTQVRLQVDESSLERAAVILDAQPAAAAEGEYVEEEYRCPTCHRKAVDLLPLSGRMRSTRLGCLGVLLLPFVVYGLIELFGGRESVLSFPPAIHILWLATLAVLSYLVLTAKRRKRCRECGHEW